MALRPVARVRLGPAQASDARELASLSRRYIESGLAWRWRAAAVLQQIREEDSCVVVARDSECLVGFAAMSFDFEGGDAHLLLLAVVPSYRRCGLAGDLLEWLEVMARRGGIERIRVEVRVAAVPARHFYRSRGFKTVSRLPGYYQQREDALQLQKLFV